MLLQASQSGIMTAIAVVTVTWALLEDPLTTDLTILLLSPRYIERPLFTNKQTMNN